MAERADGTETALTRARDRGRVMREQVLRESRPLTTAQVARLLAIGIDEVDQRRLAGQLLGLPADDQIYTYPRWQFTDTGVLPGLGDVLSEMTVTSPWMQAVFFISGDSRLGGETPLLELQRGHVESVRRAARAYGEQGAA
jgi:hypothetical protein